MSKLAAALAWAARGFPVFPLVPNGKEPAYDGSWYDMSTTDPETIKAYWTDSVLGVERDYNIGVDCTDRIVIDLDVKEGKDGINEYAAIGGTYDSLVVRTPSGGYHVYYEGPDSGNAPISRSIDVRSHHGYVVGPGSTIDGVAYEVVDARDPEWIPPVLARHLSAPYERGNSLSSNVDTEANVEAARRYLESAPPAVEGEHGDETTFKTAARCVREFGLTIATTFELMRDVYNPRCIPPWSDEELLQKVENAHEYGTAATGALDPEHLFRGIDIAPPPSVFVQAGVTWGNVMASTALTPRRWLVDRVLMEGAVTALLAGGSIGKSSWGLALAAHLALGLDFAGYKTYKACKVIVYNGEDDIEEQSRRLAAVCDLYMLPFDEVRARVLLLSEENADLRVAHLNGRSPMENVEIVKQLIELAGDPECGALILDPLIDVHDVDESDNPQMNFVLKILKRIAKEAQVALVTMHHVTKSNDRQEARVGNPDISRGASAIINKVRSSFTLLNASEKDCADYGFQDHERNLWVRMDDAKMNLSLATFKPKWFRRTGVRLMTGDVIGVIQYQEIEKNHEFMRNRVAELFLSYMLIQGTATMTIPQAVIFAKQNEPLWANLTDTEVKKRLEGVFGGGVDLRGNVLSIERGDRTLLVLS